jgi:hypothetical protein
MDNLQAFITYLHDQQEFPATQDELVEACNAFEDISDADKDWFIDTLPEGVYTSPEDVIQSLDLPDESQQQI